MTCPTKPIDLLLGKKSVRVCAKPVQVTGCNTLCGTLHCQYFIDQLPRIEWSQSLNSLFFSLCACQQIFSIFVL